MKVYIKNMEQHTGKKLKNIPKNFEGTEKKLEIILKKSFPSLRLNINNKWDRIVKATGAHIISSISNNHMDAYLLSESSLFVWEDRILMITCGKTVLTKAIPLILEIIDKNLIAHIFYERKNFLYPHLQPAQFENEENRIMVYFPGKKIRLGSVNDDHIHLFYSSFDKVNDPEDATLQILMHDIDISRAKIFNSENIQHTDVLLETSGLDRIYPYMNTDFYFFSPFGFSMNGIHDNTYFTIHITPQSDSSFASFETNVLEEDYTGIIKRMTSIFKPFKFVLSLTRGDDIHHFKKHIRYSVSDYNIKKKKKYNLGSGYSVFFSNFIKNTEKKSGIRRS